MIVQDQLTFEICKLLPSHSKLNLCSVSEQLRPLKRKKGPKKSRSKKSRRSDPVIEANASVADVCSMLGLTDVPNNFTQEDYNLVTTAKVRGSVSVLTVNVCSEYYE